MIELYAVILKRVSFLDLTTCRKISVLCHFSFDAFKVLVGLVACVLSGELFKVCRVDVEAALGEDGGVVSYVLAELRDVFWVFAGVAAFEVDEDGAFVRDDGVLVGAVHFFFGDAEGVHGAALREYVGEDACGAARVGCADPVA